MSACYGTDSAYSVYGDIHYDLNLPGAGKNELLFMSGQEGIPPRTNWGSFINNILYNDPMPDPAKTGQILKDYMDKQPLEKYDNKISIYEAISKIPKLSKIKKTLDYIGYGKINDNDITFFAPIDDVFDDFLSYDLQLGNMKGDSLNQGLKWNGPERPEWLSILNILRYHTLPYVIDTTDMLNRKLKLKTTLDQQLLEIQYKNDKMSIINPIETEYDKTENSIRLFVGNPIQNTPDGWFPKISWYVDVIAKINCSNGNLYVISRPLLYPRQG